MSKALFLSVILFLMHGQLASQCSISIPSVNGDYSVEIVLNPVATNSSACSASTGQYTIVIDYDISFVGTNFPSSMNFINANIACTSVGGTRFVELPDGPAVGTVESTDTQYPTTNCPNDLPSDLGCSMMNVSLSFNDGPMGFDNIPFTNASCQVVLPIELLSFEVVQHVHSNSAEISWSTAVEVDSDQFLVQKSTDGQSWQSIANVEASHPQGGQYSIIDSDLSSGKNYYRLKELALDGNTWHSSIETIEVTPSKRLSVYPNPFQNLIIVSPMDNEIEILDLTGRSIRRFVAQGVSTPIEIDMGDLSRGSYLLRSGLEVLLLQKM